MNLVKIELKNPDIKYLIVSLSNGRIIESGENLENQGTFEDTYLKLDTIEVGKTPTISFNYSVYTKKMKNKTPVWTELNYIITKIDNLN
jgi:hypothetical protein